MTTHELVQEQAAAKLPKAESNQNQQTSDVPGPMTRYRWTICSLIFFATTINYLDRAVISLLKGPLTIELGWNDADYANVEVAFKLTYALGMLGAGRLIDRLGTKTGYQLSVFFWSLAAVGHAFAKSTFGFGVARAALGFTESGNFPAAIKAVTEWFPAKDRAFATGIFNSGTNVGAILAPLTVPFIASAWGWQWAFIITGSLGFLWMVLWLIFYDSPEKHKKVSQAELDYIRQDEGAETKKDRDALDRPKIKWIKLLWYRQTWCFSLGKLMTDPIWWFLLFWLPDFLTSQYGLEGTQLAMPVALVYFLSAIGSVFGGWLPKQLSNRRRSVFKARRFSMLLYACCVVPIVGVQVLGEINMWLAVGIIGLAASGHQAWSANMYTVVSDLFPKSEVGSVIGIGGMLGTFGSVLFTLLVQKGLFMHYRAINEIETAYYIMFFICGGAYLAAWLVMGILVPKQKLVV